MASGSAAPSVDHDLPRIPGLDAVSMVAQQRTEGVGGMPQRHGVLCLHHDVADLDEISRSDALQHLHEVALNIDLEKIDRGQAPNHHLARDCRARYLVGMKLALVAQLVDPRELGAVENGAEGRVPRRLVQYQLPARFERYCEVK